MQVSRKKKRIALIATLIIVVTLAVCPTPVRRWLTRQPGLYVTVEETPGGMPLAGKWVEFEHDGYPSGDGRAFYWVRTHNWVSNEWLLLSLPDAKIFCRAKGFDEIYWAPGGIAVGCKAKQSFGSTLPLPGDLQEQYGGYKLDLWGINWKTGKLIGVNMDELPEDARPEISTDTRRLPINRPKSGPPHAWSISIPPLPEAQIVGDRRLTVEDPLSGGGLVLTGGSQPDRLVCSVVDASGFGGEIENVCVIDNNDAIITFWTSGTGRRPYLVELSTGKIWQIPLDGKPKAARPYDVSKPPKDSARPFDAIYEEDPPKK